MRGQMLCLLMIEGMVGVRVNSTAGKGTLAPFSQGNTCFPPIQAVKKKKAGITQEQYRITRSYEMAGNKECLMMK